MKPQATNTLGKPVLDQGTFQQLLAAAYTLQEGNVHRPAKEAGTTSTLPSDRPQSKPVPHTLLIEHVVPGPTSSSRYGFVAGRISQNDLFWRVATAVAMAAVSALLLGGSIGRFSPLPAALTLSLQLQQQVPFRRATRVATILAESSGVGASAVVMETPAAMKTEPDEPAIAAGESFERNSASLPVRKTAVNYNPQSTHEYEVNLVAPDTVVRHHARAATSPP